jgi:hypothetical protein
MSDAAVPGDPAARTAIDRAIASAGGEVRWRRVRAVEAVLSVDGFLFTTKRIRPLRQARVSAAAGEERLTLFDWPQPGWRGEWYGQRAVAIIDADGEVVHRRADPRCGFRGWRRQLWWDECDFLYFAGYALWNYLLTPFLFLRPGFGFASLPAAGGGHRIRVTFPPGVTSHCQVQTFHFSATGDIERLDYTAEVVGFWARAVHFCSDYRTYSGLRVATRRRVLPGFGLPQPLPGPTLIAIDIHDLAVHDEAAAGVAGEA